MPATTDNDKIYASIFSLELDDIPIAMFNGCSGLNVEMEVTSAKFVNNKQMSVTAKIPVKAKYSEVVLKRGYTDDNKLQKWFEEVVSSKDAQGKFRKSGSIVLYSREGEEVARFTLLNCWPSKISASDLDASNNETVIEEITIQHEMFDWT